jgi:hypothetical protein
MNICVMSHYKIYLYEIHKQVKKVDFGSISVLFCSEYNFFFIFFYFYRQYTYICYPVISEVQKHASF